MEAKDLMKGDKIGVRSNDGYDLHIFTVSEIKQNGISCGKDFVYYDFDEIEPISLTAEILAKNFKLSGYDRYYVGKDLYVKWYDNDTFGFGNMNNAYNEPQFESFTKVNSVHQLQHALRLVGLTEIADNLIV